MDKKTLFSSYQQSFRIDDLLTRKAIDPQPDHFPPPNLPSPPPSSGRIEDGAGGIGLIGTTGKSVRLRK